MRCIPASFIGTEITFKILFFQEYGGYDDFKARPVKTRSWDLHSEIWNLLGFLLGAYEKYRLALRNMKNLASAGRQSRFTGLGEIFHISSGSALFFIFSSEEPKKFHISSARPQEPIHLGPYIIQLPRISLWYKYYNFGNIPMWWTSVTNHLILGAQVNVQFKDGDSMTLFLDL